MNGVKTPLFYLKTAVSRFFVRFHTFKLAGHDETESRQRRYFKGMRKRSRMRM